MQQQDTSSSRLSTGIEGLDAILNGGLLRGSAYIVSGPAGAGKTIFGNQLCFRQASAGRKALYLTLISESHDRMLEHISGLEFFDRKVIPGLLAYQSAYQTLRDEGADGLLRLLMSEIRRHHAQLVVIDGLFIARESVGGENAYRLLLHALQGHASLTGCALLLLTNQSSAVVSPEHTMVDGSIELLDELHGARSVRTLVVRKQRGGRYLRGRHAFRITSAGLRVFPRTEALLAGEPEHSESMERTSSGIAALDGMLSGGLPVGSATLMLGPSGSGKTTFGLHFLAQCTPQAPGVLFGFQETPARLRAKAHSIGLDLEMLLQQGALELLWQSPAENLADELAQRLLDAVARRKARRVFFDGVTALRHAFVFPPRLPLYLSAINHRLRTVGATAFYTMESPALYTHDKLATNELSNIVENILLTHYAQRDQAMRRELTVLKVRDGAFDPFSREFYIDGRGIQFGADPSPSPTPLAGATRPPARTGKRGTAR